MFAIGWWQVFILEPGPGPKRVSESHSEVVRGRALSRDQGYLGYS